MLKGGFIIIYRVLWEKLFIVILLREKKNGKRKSSIQNFTRIMTEHIESHYKTMVNKGHNTKDISKHIVLGMSKSMKEHRQNYHNGEYADKPEWYNKLKKKYGTKPFGNIPNLRCKKDGTVIFEPYSMDMTELNNTKSQGDFRNFQY